MKRISCGLTLVLLTACSSDEPAVMPVAPVAPLTPTTSAPPGISTATTSKLEAKANAVALLDVLRTLESVVENADAMQDGVRYGRYFYRPLEKALQRWPSMADPRFDLYADLSYCHEAARRLSQLGERVRNKELGQQFVVTARESYQAALPKCEQAIKQFS